MTYGKKKVIIIAIVVTLLILILAGVGLFLFLGTDLFKSNEELFYKYMDGELSKIKVQTNAQLEDISKLQEQQSYITTGEITGSYITSDVAKQSQIDEVLNNLKVTIDGKYDRTQSMSNTSCKLLYGTQNLLQLDLAQNDTLYGAKCEDVVSQYYVGVRNENLKVFLQKLGIQDISQVPNEMKIANIQEIFKFTDVELQTIKDTYLPIIQENIAKANYTKQNDMIITKNSVEYKTTAYRLDLTGTEVNTLVTSILQTLQQDSVTLNLITTKAKLLGLSEDYTSVNNLTSLIAKAISNIDKNLSYFTDGLSIVQYVYEKETISTEIIVKNQIKITVSAESGTSNKNVDIQLENLSSNDNYSIASITIITDETSTNTNMELTINIDDETLTKLSTQISGAASQKSIQSIYQLEISQADGSTISLVYDETTEFVDEMTDMIELDNTKNCIILNDYDTANLQALVPAIVQRAMQVINEKVQLVTTSISQTIQNGNSNQNITDGLPQGDTNNQPISDEQ